MFRIILLISWDRFSKGLNLIASSNIFWRRLVFPYQKGTFSKSSKEAWETTRRFRLRNCDCHLSLWKTGRIDVIPSDMSHYQITNCRLFIFSFTNYFQLHLQICLQIAFLHFRSDHQLMPVTFTIYNLQWTQWSHQQKNFFLVWPL